MAAVDRSIDYSESLYIQNVNIEKLEAQVKELEAENKELRGDLNIANLRLKAALGGEEEVVRVNPDLHLVHSEVLRRMVLESKGDKDE